MPTRNIVLTGPQEQLINDLVLSGRYQNASEALRAGLRLLEQEEAGLDALRVRLEAGLAEVHSGARAEGTGEEVIRHAFAQASDRHAQGNKVG